MTIDKTIKKPSPFIKGTPSPVPILRQTFNSSTNWTVPSGVYGFWIHMAGGGAGGGGKNNTAQCSGSGGGGGAGHLVYTAVTPGSTVGITIGAGGNGGTPGTSSNARYGNDGGDTYVNTVGTSYGAGGGKVQGAPDQGNGAFGVSLSGRYIGLTRQQIVFGSVNSSPRQNIIINGANALEGGGYGGYSRQANFNQNSPVGPAAFTGDGSTYGGAGGGNGASNGASSVSSGAGGPSNIAGYNGGNGTAPVTTNSGGGGGGAGIAGNGSNGSGPTGGAGGAGGGGGGGGGCIGSVNNTSAAGGAGGAGCVKIYY